MDYSVDMVGRPLDFSEMYKLDNLLTEANIPHVLTNMYAPFDRGMWMRVYFDEAMTVEMDECLLFTCSCGAACGLLQTRYLGGRGGFETAEEVFEGWLERYRIGILPQL